MVNFTEEETDWLGSIVIAWINEGFTTPLYKDVIYDIFEKLDIHNGIPYVQYNVERSKNQSSRKV